MKAKFLAILICALLVLVFLAPAAFAVPQVINYQGELSDSSGPLNGDVSVVFTIYNAPAGGDILWSETRTVIVTDGVFSVLLGTQTAFPEYLFSGDDRYLGVKVEADQEMTPRQRLSSVPYSFASEKAGCYTGDFINCYTGPPGTMDVGVCASGIRSCNSDGMGFAPDCAGEVLPSDEVCDTLDNDCSGEADEIGCADCVYTPGLCDDAVSCTDDACDPVDGCSNAPNDSLCDDAYTCTIDACDLINDCTHTPVPSVCDDYNVCTIDDCNPGFGDPDTGCQYTPITCDDGYACTIDSCDPGSGCFFTPESASCDDGDACTIDDCNPALGNPITGCVSTSVTCDDGVACTVDYCDPAIGCDAVADDALCDDDNECTVDYCSGSGCVIEIEPPGTLCTGGTCDATGICIPD